MKRKHPAVDATGKIRTTVPMVYTRRWDGKKFDRAALITVSESLGHHRDDVVVHSYLRYFGLYFQNTSYFFRMTAS